MCHIHDLSYHTTQKYFDRPRDFVTVCGWCIRQFLMVIITCLFHLQLMRKSTSASFTIHTAWKGTERGYVPLVLSHSWTNLNNFSFSISWLFDEIILPKHNRLLQLQWARKYDSGHEKITQSKNPFILQTRND